MNDNFLYTPKQERFFDRILIEANELPIGAQFKQIQQYSDDEVIVKRMLFESSDRITIQGWTAEPRTMSPIGSIIQFPAYAEVLFPQTYLAKIGFLVFSISVRGHKGSDDVVDPGFPGLLTHGLPSAETYIYRNIVIDGLRGINELLNYTKGDVPIIAIGKSQGAALAIILAALRKEIRAISVEVPWLCSIVDSIEITDGFPYREISGYLDEYPDQEIEVYETLDLFDVCRHAHKVDCPVLIGIGTDDPVTPITSTRKLASILRDVEAHEYEGAGHEGGGLEFRVLQTKWMQEVVRAS